MVQSGILARVSRQNGRYSIGLLQRAPYLVAESLVLAVKVYVGNLMVGQGEGLSIPRSPDIQGPARPSR